MNMTVDSGMIVCGKRGGPTFMETVRVDPTTKECPRGLVPCSDKTPPSETVCVKEYEREFECPIIDIYILKEHEKADAVQLGYQVTETGFPGNSAVFIAFSKTEVREGQSYAPIISSAINSKGNYPCFGPDKDRLIIPEDDFLWLDFSLELESPISNCTEYTWRQEIEETDDRYDTVGFTNLYQFQFDNGVYDALYEEVPELFQNSTMLTLLELR